MNKDVEMIDADSVPAQEGNKVLELHPLARQVRRLCLVLALAPVGAGLLGHSSRAMADDVDTAVCVAGGSVVSSGQDVSDEGTPCSERSNEKASMSAVNGMPLDPLGLQQTARLSDIPDIPVVPDLLGSGAFEIGPAGDTASVAAGDNSLAVGLKAQVSEASNSGVAIGVHAYVAGQNSLSIGQSSQVLGDEAMAIGSGTVAEGEGALAIGSGAVAGAGHDLAIGMGAMTGANARSSLAFGDHAVSDGAASLAFGSSTYATNKNAIAIGGGGGYGDDLLAPKQSTLASADNAIAIGGSADGGSRAEGVSSIAMGARASATADQAVAIGGVKDSYFTDGTKLPATTASGVGAVAIGADLVSGAVASGESTIAIGGQSGATAANAIAIGVAAKADVADSVALGNGAVTADVVVTDKVTIAGKEYAFAGIAPKATVSIGDVGSERTLTNMAAGRLDATSTDAINGSQLFATNQQVDINATVLGENTTAIGDNKALIDRNTAAIEGNTTEISDLNDAIANAGVGENGVQYDADDHGLISLSGESGTRITNLADAGLTVDSTDAVSGRQLFATNQNVADNLTAIDSNKAAIAGNSAQINILNEAVINGGGSGSNPYMVTSAYGDKTASALGKGSIALGADSHSDTADSVAIGYGARVTRENSIAIGSGSIAGEAPKLRAYRSLDSAYDYESEYAGNTEFGEMSIGADGYERRITHVAPGRITADSTDAINGSQLFVNTQKLDEKISALDGRVNKLEDGSGGGSSGGSGGSGDHFQDNSSGGTANASGEDSIAIGGDSRAASNGGVAIGEGSVADREGMDGKAEAFSGTDVASKQGAVSVGSDGNERQITHVAGGTDDTDAVNVRQLRAVQEGSVNYDRKKDGSVDYNSMTLGKQGSGPVQIHNVADGTAPNDAVNVSQLQAMDSRYASAYDHLSDEIDEVESKASAGIAAIAAMGDAPYVAGKFTYHVGSGYYNGESALGVNLRHTADNGRWSVDFGVGTSAGDMDTAVSLGVSGVIN